MKLLFLIKISQFLKIINLIKNIKFNSFCKFVNAKYYSKDFIRYIKFGNNKNKDFIIFLIF